MRRLRLRQVHLLQEIARQPSLTAAAEVLNMTQPAVSQQLADIEAALGVTLFERGKGVHPTAYGEAALRWAAQTVASARQLDD
jgi:DNA-binding transcriptional LysR family regulator